MDKKIELLALDVDGTLVTPDQRIPEDVVDAIANVTQAGLRVCIATGRSFAETLPVWQQLRLPKSRMPEPVITIGGALVVEPTTGRTLYQKPIPRDLTVACANAFVAAGHSAMGIVDAWRYGYDYLFIRGKDFGDAHRMWFGQMPPSVKIREVSSFNGDTADVLRLNSVIGPEDTHELERHMRAKMGESLNVHSIYAPNYGVYVVETFAQGCDKWTALKYIAQGYRIGPGAIAAVGDDVNDIPMLKGAGLGVAMPNASDPVKAIADTVATAGLAEFIRSLRL